MGIEQACKEAAALGCTVYNVPWCEVLVWYDDGWDDWCAGLAMLDPENRDGDGRRLLSEDWANGLDIATALTELIEFLRPRASQTQPSEGTSQ